MKTVTEWSTRNSRNARTVPGIAFGTGVPPRNTSSHRLPSITPSESQFEEIGSDHGDDILGIGNKFRDGNLNGPSDDQPDDDGPGDHPEDDDLYDDNQPNLTDAITALARNVQDPGDGSQAKVREPDPFDSMDPTKLQTFLVQLQLSFNDCPSAFANN